MLERFYGDKPDEDALFEFWVYVPKSGRSTAKALLNKISDEDFIKAAKRAKIVEKHGEQASREIFTCEQGKIWALKSGQFRFYCFREGNVWIVTHGVTKKTRKADPKALEKADFLRVEYKERGGQ